MPYLTCVCIRAQWSDAGAGGDELPEQGEVAGDVRSGHAQRAGTYNHEHELICKHTYNARTSPRGT